MVFKKPKYKIYDGYEGTELIGYADNISDAKTIAKERVNDTDGECYVFGKELDEETGEYKIIVMILLMIKKK